MHYAFALFLSRAAGLVLMASLFGPGPDLAHAGGPPFIITSGFGAGGRATDMVVDAAGNVYLAGVIASYNFTGVNSASIANAGMDLRYVVKVPPLSSTAAVVAVVGAPTSTLLAARSTDFGKDEATGLALDANGNAYLVAYDGSKDYPVSGGQYFETTGKKYVFKVTASGQVTRFSSVLDPAIKRIGAIAVDAGGNILLTGSANEGLLTTAGAPYPTSSVAPGCMAPFVMKLDATGQSALYATYLGYSGTQSQMCGGTHGSVVDPTGFAIAVDSIGNAYVTGQAEPGLPASPGAVDLGTKIGTFFSAINFGTASHAFVTKINSTGTTIIFSARIGGSLRDRSTSIVVDGAGAPLIAGKTSSRDFPTAGGGPGGYFPYTGVDCLTNTPEVGFVTKLSADGRQIVFSNYVPMDGGQLDDCQAKYDGTLDFEPAKIALDPSGNILIAGFTDASKRDLNTTPDALMSDAAGSISSYQVFQILSPDGRQLIYSSGLPSYGVRGIAMDRWQNVIVAGYSNFMRISPGSMPLDVSVTPAKLCAGQTATLSAHVAGSNDNGTLDLQVDGASIGSSPIVNGYATKATNLAVGIRKIRATYHGAGHFDGYSSSDVYVVVNQAGVCP